MERKAVNTYTGRLCAGGNKNIVNHLGDGRFVASAGVKRPKM